ncbi:oligosaccharide repeat unit polymerase [Larkinella arboricola]|uniref:Oligosaccharide repeat unit polymerase n=1 Tax=Larkinella arboricola TaxID=643671 RepID=A0A327X6B3_LARAB|nr:O-antigen ligase family protein [Larkinella arboricola]RAK02557.1 oligosaccharide repeat unit polymerase [Larkinella arboricola]
MKKFGIAFSLTLLGFESFTNNIVIKLIPLLLLVLLLLYNIFNQKNKRRITPPPYIYILLCIIIMGTIRNNHPNSSITHEIYRLSCFLLVIITFIQTINTTTIKLENDLHKLFYWTIYIPIFILILINILGHLIGLTSIRDMEVNLGEALILSEFGIHVDRVLFPFAIGFNSYSIIVGIFLLLSIYSLLFYNRYKLITIIGFALSTATLLLIDTRSALLYPFILLPVVFYIRKKPKMPSFIWATPLIMIFGSALLMTILTFAVKIPELAFLGRSSTDFETGNSRSFIWLISSLEFISFKPIHLIGYGEYGHYKSGASLEWSNIFGQWGDSSDLITPHSVFYSILFDYGYIGLLLIIIFQYKIISLISKYWKSSTTTSILLALILFYWNLIGVTEAAFGFYTPNILILLILFSIFAHSQDSLNSNHKEITLPSIKYSA